MQFKQKLKKWLPNREAIKNQPGLKWLDFLLHQPDLWHFNKHAVARGVAAGLLVAFVPLPFQMLLAILVALLFRANIPVAAAVTWITNPFTFVPITLLIIKVGSWFTGIKPVETIKMAGAQELFATLGKNFLIGLPVVSVVAAIVGYLLVRVLWRFTVITRRYGKK